MQWQLDNYEINRRTLISQSYLLVMIKSLILDSNPVWRNWAINQRVHEDAWPAMKDQIGKMASIANSIGVPFLVVIYPWEVQLSNDASSLAPQRDLAAFFNAHNIVFIDTYDVLKTHNEEPTFLHDGVHLTAYGHAVTAQEIVEEIEERGWIEPTRDLSR